MLTLTLVSVSSNSPAIQMDMRLKHPFTMMVAGPTSCGKSQWTKKLLLNASKLIDQPPTKITWFYGEYQPLYAELQAQLQGISFVEGIPENLNSYIDAGSTNLVVIDDLMSESGNNKRISKLFTKGSHHRNLSVIYIVQNLFHKGSENRDISLNTHYLVLFKNPRDASQITSLAKQMYPGSVKFLQEAYRDATLKPHGYLLLDMKPGTVDDCRIRTGIFPGDTYYVYQRKV